MRVFITSRQALAASTQLLERQRALHTKTDYYVGGRISNARARKSVEWKTELTAVNRTQIV